MLADVIVVDSRDAAIQAIRSSIPDVLLLSALLSPRDEDELIQHLRTLNAHHLQTHTIPQLASTLEPGEKRGGGGLFSAFRRKKDKDSEPPVAGCEPELFAEEIRTYLQRAETKKREMQEFNGQAPDMRLGPISERSAAPAVAEPEPEAGVSSSSSWDDPFAWKPSGGSSARTAPATPAPKREPASTESIFKPESEPLAEPEPLFAGVDSILASPEPAAPEPFASIDEPFVRRSDRDAIGEPVTAFVDGQQVAIVQGEPSLLIPQPYSVMKPAAEMDEAAAIEPEAAREPEPLVAVPQRRHALIDTNDAEDLPEITLVDEPVEIAEPLIARPHSPASRVADNAAETLINLDADPYYASAEEPRIYARSDDTPADESGFGEWTFAPDDSPAIAAGAAGVNRLGPLATWARTEPRRAESPSTADDLRMLLGGLAVPAEVAGVRYPRGVRIRRVRVPAARANEAGDSVGPVILSRKALADRREQRV